jgi:hypothetical protein
MSDTSTLAELAKFVGRSQPNLREAAARASAAPAPAARPQRASVADLLGVVLVLSARTRRLIQPKADIDLDVFSPNGGRAVRLLLPQADHRSIG